MRQALDQSKLKAIYDHVARRYDFQHSFFTARSDERGRQLVVEKAVRPGDKVLDCGAGTGSTALLAAQRVGEPGHVTLLDFSQGMLSVARKRAASEGVGNLLDFQVGDMFNLPFGNDSFDVGLSTYSMCPLYDPAVAALELLRVVKPGGRIGIAHSGSPENPVTKWIADIVEDLVWRIPAVSLGCRSVSVLPTMLDAGCGIIFKKNIGIPLWPFLVFVVEKPTK